MPGEILLWPGRPEKFGGPPAAGENRACGSAEGARGEGAPPGRGSHAAGAPSGARASEPPVRFPCLLGEILFSAGARRGRQGPRSEEDRPVTPRRVPAGRALEGAEAPRTLAHPAVTERPACGSGFGASWPKYFAGRGTSAEANTGGRRHSPGAGPPDCPTGFPPLPMPDSAERGAGAGRQMPEQSSSATGPDAGAWPRRRPLPATEPHFCHDMRIS